MNKIYLIVLFFVLIFIALLIIVFRRPVQTQDTPPSPIPISTSGPVGTFLPVPSNPGYSQEYIKQSEEMVKRITPRLKQEQAIAKLREFLPYKGTNFTMIFNYKTFIYEVSINSQNQADGSVELDSFLKKNGIESREWFKDSLQIKAN